MTSDADLRTVALATLAAVATSAAWYAAWTPRLAQYDDAYAAGGDGPSPAAVLPVEVARTATVATAVAVLAGRTRARGPGDTIRWGLGLWAAFPMVLLTGSVFHQRVALQEAAIHARDWLVKLTVIATIVGRRR